MFFLNSRNDALLLCLHDIITLECLLIMFSLDVMISRVSSRHKLHTCNGVAFFIIDQLVLCHYFPIQN
uniref:Uncharacterized protein n=1 Tax=Octopus bimaculoides TaxID=37653 RepID=A0A0L8G5Q3_OCTBM